MASFNLLRIVAVTIGKIGLAPLNLCRRGQPCHVLVWQRRRAILTGHRQAHPYHHQSIHHHNHLLKLSPLPLLYRRRNIQIIPKNFSAAAVTTRLNSKLKIHFVSSVIINRDKSHGHQRVESPTITWIQQHHHNNTLPGIVTFRTR